MLGQFEDDLRYMHDVLGVTQLSGHYWVCGGMLLGWAREGSILAHDSLDADFGVVDEDFQRLVSAVPELVRAGFKAHRRFMNNDGDITELTFMRHGACFEFFRFYPRAGNLRYFVYADGPDGAVEAQGSVPDQPIVPFDFVGRSWLKHEDHDLELRANYGNWEVVDKEWSYMDDHALDDRCVWKHPDFDWRGELDGLR